MKRDFRPDAGSFAMPDEIRNVMLSQITVGKRERPIDQAKVKLQTVGHAPLQQAEADKSTARPRGAKDKSTPPPILDKPLPDAITITLKDSAKDIAAALVGAFTDSKGEIVARMWLAELRRRKSSAKQIAAEADDLADLAGRARAVSVASKVAVKLDHAVHRDLDPAAGSVDRQDLLLTDEEGAAP